MEGKKKKKERRIMPSLVATTSALALKPCVPTHYVRTKRKKERRRIMPSLVATTSALARIMGVRTHYVRTNSRNHHPCQHPLVMLTSVNKLLYLDLEMVL